MTKLRIEDLVLVGFNKQVVALDRFTGEVKWDWKSPKGSGYPSILLDGDRIIICVSGYTYCLEPTSGSVVWENELKGYGVGISCVASMRGNSQSGGPASQQAADAAAAASASSGGGAG